MFPTDRIQRPAGGPGFSGNGIKNDRGKSGGKDHLQVHQEFIPHGNALGTGGGDGGIRDHTHVVAEHGTADNCPQHQRGREAHGLDQPHSNGRQHCDRAATGPDGKRDETGDQEKAHQQKLIGDQMAADQHGGIHRPHGFCHGGERARKNEDQAHDHDIAFTHAMSKDLHLVRQFPFPVQQQRRSGRHQKRNRHRHAVKILCPAGKPHIKYHEHEKRDQRLEAGFPFGIKQICFIH